MREAKLIEVTELDVEQIDVSERLRPVSDAAVDALIASIEELGVIKDEVLVRKVRHKGGKLKLIAGGHRVEACRRLSRKVPAKVFDCTDDWARLMEVDDNLAGAELTALDTAVFLAERKRVYEQLHPETKQGAAGLVAMRGSQTDTMSVWAGKHAADMMSVASFAKVTAEKFGMTERHVRRLVAAGNVLDVKDRRLLREAAQPVTLADLQQIAKIDNVAERYEVIERFAKGEVKKIAVARKEFADRSKGVQSPVEDPVNDQHKALLTAFKRAGAEARRRFVRDLYGELGQLMAVEAVERGQE